MTEGRSHDINKRNVFLLSLPKKLDLTSKSWVDHVVVL